MQKIILCLCILSISSLSPAATVWNPAANGISPPAAGDWSAAANWTNGLPVTDLPGELKAVFNVSNAAECVITDTQSCRDIVQGDGGPGGVIRIADGGNLTTTGGWMSVGYNNTGKMIVETGGVFNCSGHMWNGMHNTGVGTIELNGGTINVGANFGLGWYNGTQNGTAYFYVNSGTLNLDHWSYPASIHEGSFIDITGGTVTIKGDKRANVQGFIDAGKIKAFDATGHVNYDYNQTNPGKTTITATPLIVTVPDVTGLLQANAHTAVEAALLSIGIINTTSTAAPDTPTGTVISQSPQAGTTADTGSMVDLLVYTGPEVPTDQNWTNEGEDRQWNNPANWSNHVVPRSIDKAAIRNQNISGPVIDSSTDATANVLVLGDWSSSIDTLDMTGGSLTTNSWFIIGYGSANDGAFTISNGTVSIGGNLNAGFNGKGTIEITGGSIAIAGTFGIAQNAGSTGNVSLDGGTVSTGDFYMTSGGLLDITAGTLIINGNAVSQVETYEDNGWITPYGGIGKLNIDYNVSNSGKTTVTAEPASPPSDTGDINGDGRVNETDLSLLAAHWLAQDPDPDADLSKDGKVNMDDFQIMSKTWQQYDYSKTLTGKIMCGYQGWFNTPTDGANRGWVHWGRSNKFEPGYCTIDFWPDMSEYDPDEKFATPFRYPDGSVAHVFSSYKEKTVLRHFLWMQQYGIDGVFLQRFASETTPGSTSRNHRDKVMLHCRKGANMHKRAWAMMYDLSSKLTGPELKQKVINDWKHLVDTYQLTKDPTDKAYLHHNGKPVVAVWGLGFNRSYEGQDTRDIIDFLKNDPVYGGCTIMIGVDNEWRDRMNTDQYFGEIVQMADIISPWAVGRYGSKNQNDLNSFTNNYTIPDQQWCNNPQNNKDYLPVVFPGFSWQNLQQNNKFDQTPRLGGRFLWRQMYKAIADAGVTMIYQAMFDEVDEGTAIFKVTPAPPIADSTTGDPSTPFLPTGNADFAPYDFSDSNLPSDHYLWLVGEATKMLRGEIPQTETIPTR